MYIYKNIIIGKGEYKMTSTKLKRIKRRRQIRNEILLMGLYDFATLALFIATMVATVFIIGGHLS